MKILDGRTLASRIREEVKQEIEKKSLRLELAIILVGDDKASRMYIQRKIEACSQASIVCTAHELPADTKQHVLEETIHHLNRSTHVTGIIIQLPLPSHIDRNKVLSIIDPDKDVDGLTPKNLGALHLDNPRLVPCTPYGIMELLVTNNISVRGKHVVIIGAGILVGKPLAMLMLREGATVSICTITVSDLSSFTKQADIIVSAAGKPHLVKASMVKPGAVVIDVGTTFINGKLTGDVDFEDVAAVASAITPIYGGVGPMTVAMILKNLLTANSLQHG